MIMRAFQIQDQFGLQHLTLVERDDPKPGPSQIVVKVAAASLNYRDWLMINGQYNPKQPLPLIPLSDGVGIVEAIGADVDSVAVGDRVAGIFAQNWLAGEPDQSVLLHTVGGPIDGMLAERVILNASGVVPVPAHLTDEEAATLPCAAVTAWSALFERRPVQPGDTVLIQGTGGVSIFALQFAKLAGCRVAVISSSDERLERCVQLGADYTLNYRAEPKWDKAIRAWTSGVGVDRVIEVGGQETFNRSLKAVRHSGVIAMIGILSGNRGDIDLVPILMRRIDVQGIFVGARATFVDMNRAIAMAELRPAIHSVTAFEDAPQAFEQLERGGHFGKLVIRIG